MSVEGHTKDRIPASKSGPQTPAAAHPWQIHAWNLLSVSTHMTTPLILTLATITTMIVAKATDFMATKISTLEIRQRLGDILNRVALRHDEFIIERKGKPLAAMIPVEKLEHMQRAARLHLADVLTKQSPSNLSQDEADNISNEAKHQSREKAGKRRK